jgi:opacity protein-like surface antigen
VSIVLRKLILIITFCIFLTTKSYASIFLGLSANSTDAGDAKKQVGYGFDIGADLMPGLNLFLKTKQSSVSEDNGDKEYSHLMVFGVVEQNFQIKRLPLFATVALGVGYNKTEIDKKNLFPEPDVHQSDKGFGYALWGGVRYHLTQMVSPFVNVGYHKALYQNDFEKADISGVQINIGATFTFFGKNNGLFSQY